MRNILALLLLFILVMISGCEPESSKHADSQVADNEQVDSVAVNLPWPDLIQSESQQLLSDVETLHRDIQTFLNSPDQESLQRAQVQWLQSLQQAQNVLPWLYLSMGDGRLDALRQNILYWPFYPGFIDSFADYRNSGMVNTIDLILNQQTIRQQHQAFDTSELSLGLFPIGYLLWGYQGKRLAADFSVVEEVPAALVAQGVSVSDISQNRRRLLLNYLNEFLLQDVSALLFFWQNQALFFAELKQSTNKNKGVIFKESLVAYGAQVNNSLADFDEDATMEPYSRFWLHSMLSANADLYQQMFTSDLKPSLWSDDKVIQIDKQWQVVAAFKGAIDTKKSDIPKLKTEWDIWLSALQE